MATKQPGAAWIKNSKGVWVKPAMPTDGATYEWNDTTGWIRVKTSADFAAEYGVQAALVNSDPGLRSLFERAVAEKWTAAKFQAEFRNTSWYLTNSDTWRVAETSRTTDPASWNQQLNLMSDTIRKQSVALGFELSPDQVAKLANQSLYMGGGTVANVNPDWLKSQVVETGRLTGQGGTSLQLIDSLKTLSYKNGMSYSDSWYESAAKDVLMGAGAANEYEKQIRDAAKSKYAALAPQIEAGMSVMDIASPYFQTMAARLEADQNTLTLNDPLLQRALTGLSENGEPQLQPLWKFEQEVKKDNRYFQTNNAHREFLDVSTEIARQFGKAV
jgi:hypothetical protein